MNNELVIFQSCPRAGDPTQDALVFRVSVIKGTRSDGKAGASAQKRRPQTKPSRCAKLYYNLDGVTLGTQLDVLCF